MKKALITGITGHNGSYCKKSRIFTTVTILLVTLSNLCYAESSSAQSAKGISSIFMKRREIMAGDSWGNPPLRKDTAAKNLSRYDAVWCAQLVVHHNQPAWEFLRQTRPEILMLYYIAADSTRPDSGFDYDYINTHHPQWFLLQDAKSPKKADANDVENRMRWTTNKKSSSYNRFLLDFGNKDFQEWAANRTVELVSGKKKGLSHAYDGLALDNVHVGFWHRRFAKRYPKWKYAGNQQERNKNYIEYLKTIKRALNKHGFILVANHSLSYGSDAEDRFWNMLLESVDGVMTEQSLRRGNKAFYTNEKWLTSIRKHEETLEKGLLDWWVCYHPESTDNNYGGFMYTYCSWLLVQRPGKSFYYATRGDSSYARPTVPWYEEYEIPIGKPVSQRYKSGKCWLRDYTNAKIIVNPTGRSQHIAVDKEKYWLDWTTKEKVTEILIAPATGRILLPTPYAKRESEKTVLNEKPGKEPNG